ncbi:unnamed protein product [Moneuplotes crassus]|uniref:Uncharacterized protein n=1 Tax=Euplotes crassus TaxID=5936 RepID=A0AAD1U8A8_EUPCR|nr:unnamed protein product [Moneuplotes crassus]
MSRLFEQFQKKNTVPKVSKVSSKSKPEEVVIAIKLKSNADKRTELDDNFVKVIEYEYAVKYLEIMGVSPSPKMIAMLLKNHPLSSCELSSGWSKTGWLADVIYIYPNKKAKQNNREEESRGFPTKSASQPELGRQQNNLASDSKIKPYKINVDKIKADPSKKEDTERAGESKKKELNMDPQYWQQKFLYPFLVKDDLETGKFRKPKEKIFMKTQPIDKNLKNEFSFDTIIDDPELKFPLNKLQKGTEGVLEELQVPLQVKIEDIILDIKKFANRFPKEYIPHLNDTQVIDKAHNFNRLDKGIQSIPVETLNEMFPNNPTLIKKFLHSMNKNVENKPRMIAKPTLTADDIIKALDEINSNKFARFTGLICHLVYWSVFGEINQVPLEDSYKKDLYIETVQVKTYFETKYAGKKKFTTLIMPLILLALRVMMEIIFKNAYPLFFSEPLNEKIGMKHINLVITKLLDPNLFCSRFSFFESDKESISLKYGQNKKGIGLSALKAKYNGRSTLMETLIPVPSEGKIRKMFNGYQPSASSQPKLPGIKKSQSVSKLQLKKKKTIATSSTSSFTEFDFEAKEQHMQKKLEEMNKKAKLFRIAVDKVNKHMKFGKLKR